MQRNIQTELNFSSTPAGEACEAGRAEPESLLTVNEPEGPASTNRLMEAVCERENLKEALRRVANNTAGSGLGPWSLAKAKALSVGLSNAYFKSLGLPSLVDE